jgi:hypothetical protein
MRWAAIGDERIITFLAELSYSYESSSFGHARLNAAICAKLNRGGQDGTICCIPGDPSAPPFGQRNPIQCRQPARKRGRPRGSRNKMPRVLKEMIAEVAEEVGRVDRKDWDMLLCGDDDWSQRLPEIPGR